MSTFHSTTTINKPAAEVYDFLSDLNNHQQLMATDDISQWSSTIEKARFSIRNAIILSIQTQELQPNNMVRITAVDNPPFEIELKWELTPVENNTKVDFTITAALNMMMKMVASGPLQKLADEEIANLVKLLN
ncbi:MAG: SRPBCC family protein [Mucilaginibacter sp.]